MPSYCSMLDQSHAPWYVTVDATAEHTGAVLNVLNAAPESGLDLTPEIPHWLRLGGDSGNRHLFLATGGVVTVSLSPPPVGGGTIRPQGLVLMDIYRTLWRVTLIPIGDAYAWVPPGWVPSGWLALDSGDYSLTMVQEAFETHLPQGMTFQQIGR